MFYRGSVNSMLLRYSTEYIVRIDYTAICGNISLMRSILTVCCPD